jgi:pimeloyl-ACP methyl ester carboxylesterase
VVLVHGLGRSHHSMDGLARGLTAQGYVVVAPDYPSTRQSIEQSAAVIGEAIDRCRAQSATPVNFVTHSLGGLVLAQYFQDHEIVDPGRVVMLGPPSHGSEIIDHLQGRRWFRRLAGPAGGELSTDPGSFANQLRPIPLDIGVIAGDRSLEPWFARYFHGPNDGKVSVASARRPDMKDFVVIQASHTFIANSREAARQVVAFLATGKFLRAAD